MYAILVYAVRIGYVHMNNKKPCEIGAGKVLEHQCTQLALHDHDVSEST